MMEGNSVVASSIVIPIARRGNAIRKIRPIWHTPSVAGTILPSNLKENMNNYWQKSTKTRTVLLNDMLNKSNGCCKKGNMLITKMTMPLHSENMLHSFTLSVKKEL